MPLDTLLAFALFAFVSSITPGPNNLMLLSSGVNFGFKKSIRHMLGVIFGFFLLLVCVGLGIGQLMIQLPWAFYALKWCGGIYLLYLAWVIATSTSIEESDNFAAKPMSFLSASLFQVVNPKAWIMAISAYGLYVPVNSGTWIIISMAALYAAICLPCIMVWVTFGLSLRRYLSNTKKLRHFNYLMAFLLVLSLYPLITEQQFHYGQVLISLQTTEDYRTSKQQLKTLRVG